MGGHAVGKMDATLLGDQEFDGLFGRVSQVNGLCMAANCKTHGLAAMHMQMQILAARNAHEEDGDDGGEGSGEQEKNKPQVAEEKDQLLDGIPESFIGPLLVDLVAHEVGHTLGLRHNFKGSSLYDYSEINSEDLKG